MLDHDRVCAWSMTDMWVLIPLFPYSLFPLFQDQFSLEDNGDHVTYPHCYAVFQDLVLDLYSCWGQPHHCLDLNLILFMSVKTRSFDCHISDLMSFGTVAAAALVLVFLTSLHVLSPLQWLICFCSSLEGGCGPERTIFSGSSRCSISSNCGRGYE